SSTSSRSPWLAHSPQCIGHHSVTAPGPLPVTRAPANGRDRTGLTDIDADALQHLVRRANFLPYLPYGSSHDLSIQGKISRYYIPVPPKNPKRCLAPAAGRPGPPCPLPGVPGGAARYLHGVSC